MLVIIILNSPYLQSLIAKKAIEYFSNAYNIELSVGEVYLKIPNQIVLSDISMKDSCGNVMLSAAYLNATVDRISFKNTLC